MSYDFSAFCGNVIQLTAKETFPPELPVFAGCRAGARALGQSGAHPVGRDAWQSRPERSAAACEPPRGRQRAGMLGSAKSRDAGAALGPVAHRCQTCGAQETKGSKKLSKASPSSAPSRLQGQGHARERGRRGKGQLSPSLPNPTGAKAEHGDGRSSCTYPRLGADRRAGSECSRAGAAAFRSRHPVLAPWWELLGSCLLSPRRGHEKATERAPCGIWQAGGTGGCLPAFSLRVAQAGGRHGHRGQESPTGLRQPPSHRPPSFPVSGGPGRAAPFQAVLR